MKIKFKVIMFFVFSGLSFFENYAMSEVKLTPDDIQKITLRIVQPLRDNKKLRESLLNFYEQMKIDVAKQGFDPRYYGAACLRVLLEFISQTNQHPDYQQIGVYRDAFTTKISEQKQQENIETLISKLSELHKSDSQLNIEACLKILSQIVGQDEQAKLSGLLGNTDSCQKKIKRVFDSYYQAFMDKGGDRECKVSVAPVRFNPGVMQPKAEITKKNKSFKNLMMANVFLMGLFAIGFESLYAFSHNPNYVRSPEYGSYVRYTPYILMSGLLMLKTFCALLLN